MEKEYEIIKSFGFGDTEDVLEKLAAKGYETVGFSWTHAFKDVFVITIKKVQPFNARFKIEKYLGWDSCEEKMNVRGNEGWKVCGTNWEGSLIKDIFVVLYMKNL